jgi:hypothetical protein
LAAERLLQDGSTYRFDLGAESRFIGQTSVQRDSSRERVGHIRRTGRWPLKSATVKPKFVERIQADPCRQQADTKIFFHFSEKYAICACPASIGEAFRDRHGRGKRDAVDAMCCETSSMLRTVKSCGPGAATLASSLQAMILRVTGTRKPAPRGERV